MNILVVDDEKEIADVVELFISRMTNTKYSNFTTARMHWTVLTVRRSILRSWILCFRILTDSRSSSDSAEIYISGDHADGEDGIHG